jgi:hypothetical protein
LKNEEKSQNFSKHKIEGEKKTPEAIRGTQKKTTTKT